MKSGEAQLGELEQRVRSLNLLKVDQSRNLEELANTKNELKIGIQNLDDLYRVSATIEERDSLKEKLSEEKKAFETQSAEKKEIEEQLDRVQEEKKSCETELAEKQCEVTDFERQTKEYEECLPVVGVAPMYREIKTKCGFSDDDQPKLHYIFSRLAVLVAVKNLTVDASDKSVMFRDAFNAFDQAVYAHFRDNAELLQQLRGCFEAELNPLLHESLRFCWPHPNDTLDLKEHKPDLENGEGIIKEVRSAVLYTGSGELIQNAVVLT